jgi:hypothetical protein
MGSLVWPIGCFTCNTFQGGVSQPVTHPSRRLNRSYRTYQILSKQVQKCFPTGIDAKDRPLRLTYIKLRDEIGTSMLEDCKAYFQHFSSTPSCFNDLKPIVCRLPDAELSQFRYFMYQQAAEYNSEAQEDSQVCLSLLSSLFTTILTLQAGY